MPRQVRLVCSVCGDEGYGLSSWAGEPCDHCPTGVLTIPQALFDPDVHDPSEKVRFYA